MLDEDGDAQLRLQHRSQRQVGDAQVDGHADRAVLRVDAAGDGDADRGDVPPQLAPGVLDEPGDLADERRPVRRRDVLVEDAVPIVGDDDRGLGAADVDAGDQRPVEPRLVGRDHRTSPRPSCCSMSSADAPSTTTSSWTWPNSICVSRASRSRTLDRA